MGWHGNHFGDLDPRNQRRFHKLVSEHAHAVNAAVTGLTALPGTAKPFAATRAMTRFLNNPALAFAALITPAHDAVRTALAEGAGRFALVIHDWCMFQFNTHTSKKDRHRRSHEHDLGYDLGTALVADAADGRPLGPMEFRLRTQDKMLATRVGAAAMPPGHIDELLDAMEESRRWNLGKTPVHVIDREADSVGHYRAWHAAGHKFLVRADANRLVRWRGNEVKLDAVVAGLTLEFQDVLDAEGKHEIVTTRKGAGFLRVAETEVVLDRPAVANTGETTPAGHKKKKHVPGEALTLRLVVTRVVDELGVVLAEWMLFTNVAKSEADAAAAGCWYAWRWRIESYHKLLKTAGLNAEEWQQDCGEAFLRRLIVASMACLTVWHLQRDDSEDAARLRAILVRLSGRQMAYRVESTAPALLAGLEKLLAFDDLLQREDIAEILALARKVLPTLFRSG